MPLVPFLLGLGRAFQVAAVLTGLVFFAIGALNHWLPLYLHRVKLLSVPEATFWFGVLSATGGLLGVVAGGFVGNSDDALALSVNVTVTLLPEAG